MPRLFNATTGLLEDVESPEESYLSGTHGILKTETANLVSPDSGDVFKIPQPEVEGLLRTGFTFEGEDAALTRKIRNEVKGEGFYGGLKKFVKEAADEALTLGTSEAFLDAKQDPKSEAYKRRQAEEEAHPIANIAGGLTGGSAHTASYSSSRCSIRCPSRLVRFAPVQRSMRAVRSRSQARRSRACS